MLKENILLYYMYLEVNSCHWSFWVLPFHIDLFNNTFVPLCYFPLKSSSLNNLRSTPVTQDIGIVFLYFADKDKYEIIDIVSVYQYLLFGGTSLICYF